MRASSGVKIGVIGYQGRMGKAVCEVLFERGIEPFIKGGDLMGDKTGIFENSSVVIDFSSPDGLNECLDFVADTGTPLVSGTTGLDDELVKKMKKISEKTKICWSANMSIGVLMVRKALAMIAKQMNSYDCEIIEKHHNQKKDAPSGTALMLGQTVAEARLRKLNDIAVFDRQTAKDKIRHKGQIGFSSVRGGSVFGEHEVIFFGEDESIEIKHTAYSRKLFANGAVDCALKLLETDGNGLFSVGDLLLK